MNKKNVFNFNLHFLVHLMHFLFRISIALFIFYFLGNYHNFLDTNQLLILRVLQSFASLSALISISVFVLQVIVFIKKLESTNRKATIRSFFFFIISILLVVFSSAIIVISKM
ncbi:MAG: hypothetical protein IJU92_09140 [Spirochaetaceae bacterium]|nr:hypothetical protein [Spirochaetaceae bacterium]